MSSYKNFIQDFPSRCQQILENFQKEAERDGVEVTQMLSIASVVIIIPFERFKKEHPAKDHIKFQSAKGKFENQNGKCFLASDLWNKDIGSWEVSTVSQDKTKENPDSWGINYEKLPKIIKVICVLKHIRNALAHGSIFTLPNENDKIKEIIFLSEIRIENKFCGNYDVLKVCPEDFKEFLQNWMKFLIEDLKIPAEVGQT